MTANLQPWRRDPKNPGAPIIPRGEWDFPPYHRWTFQHVREMVPTAEIWRGPGPVLPLPERKRDIDSLTFDTRAGRRTIPQWLEESAPDGFLVLSRGEIVDERYMHGLKPDRQHLAIKVNDETPGALDNDFRFVDRSGEGRFLREELPQGRGVAIDQLAQGVKDGLLDAVAGGKAVGVLAHATQLAVLAIHIYDIEWEPAQPSRVEIGSRDPMDWSRGVEGRSIGDPALGIEPELT